MIYKILVGLVVGLILTVSVSLVIWQVVRKQDPAARIIQSRERRLTNQTGPGIVKLKRYVEDSTSVQEEPKIPQAELDAAITFLENLDRTQSRTQAVSTNTSLADSDSVLDSNEETPLSYEEELKQRLHRIMMTPEWKIINGRFNELVTQSLAFGMPEELLKRKYEYSQNPFSVFGLTEEEADERDWSSEELEFMRAEGTRIQQKIAEAEAPQMARQREMENLNQQRLKLLGMTEEEFRIALGRK